MTLRVLFAGTPAAAAHVLGVTAAQESSHMYTFVGALTRKDAPAGRGRTLRPSPVAVKAEELNLPVIKANGLGPKTLAAIASLNIDIVVVVAYGVLLRQEMIDAVPLGWINLHYSLLPAWRGAAPIQACLRAGDTRTGTTVFQIDAGMDTGNVLAQQETAVISGETAGQLLNRLSESGATLLIEVLDRIARAVRKGERILGTSQEDMARQTNVAISYAPKIRRPDAQIKWEVPGETVMRLISAMNPEPGAWSFVDAPGKKNGGFLKIFEAGLAPEKARGTVDLEPGELAAVDGHVWVGAGDNRILEITQVQPEGKKLMLAADWLRGFNGSGKYGISVRLLSGKHRG